jgi:hypothetical protein
MIAVFVLCVRRVVVVVMGAGSTMALASLTAMWPRPPKPTTPVVHAAPLALAPKWASGE